MYILGLSAWYHDSGACLVRDGVVVAAAQEERFTRKKHDPAFPAQAAQYCLKQAGIDARELDSVIFYEKPFLKFERILETYLAFAPRGFASFAQAMPLWIKGKLFQKSVLIKQLQSLWGCAVDWQGRLLFSEHHLSHAASAFFPSPFARAAVLTLDGVGEWTTSSLAIGNGSSLEIIKELYFPHSLGLLYSAFTYYTGFRVNSGEHKMMGLAPYGEPRYVEQIREQLIDIRDDGSYQLNMRYFGYGTSLKMTNSRFHRLFGGPPRKPESAITQRDMDLAASVQKVTEEVVIRLARSIARETGESQLCLAGGVALNCVANGMLHRENIFRDIWIQPAAGDAGGALGAALAAHCLHWRRPRVRSGQRDEMRGAYLGPRFNDREIEQALREAGAMYHRLTEQQVIDQTAAALAEGKVVGWMQGRMEFGPRALGGRSILADPRSATMQRQLNLKIKYRESFRPFAPSVLAEHVSEWFDHEEASPYMLLVAEVQKSRRLQPSEAQNSLFGIDKLNAPRSSIPAVTHVDYSARVQTVHADTNPRYHALIARFHQLTGCPVLINTSFNVRGEPIVCTPQDAFRCFMGTEMDVLVMENVVVHKSEQPASLRQSYQHRYALD